MRRAVLFMALSGCRPSHTFTEALRPAVRPRQQRVGLWLRNQPEQMWTSGRQAEVSGTLREFSKVVGQKQTSDRSTVILLFAPADFFCHCFK